ncbi:hypothetical protein ABPG77_000652 [Micractinium sp. CCAP 211/92]
MVGAVARSHSAAGCQPPAGWRAHFWRWWLHSAFQQSWLRLAIQVGVCTLLIMCIFSAPPVWELHQYDPILANPVLILVLANLGLLFSVNTGLPILKIGWESLLGSLPGGACVYAVTYLVYAINGGSGQPGVLKAAMTMLFGAIFLLLGTACRYRWREHFALGGIFFNLTIAVGLSVSYVQHDRLWRFMLYWWWFVGLALVFMVPVGMLVLPLPVGRVVRKQLAKALRQEGAVLEAIVQLLTADDAELRLGKLGKAGSSLSSMDVEAGMGSGSSAAAPSPDSTSSPEQPGEHTQEQPQEEVVSPAEGVDEDGEPDFPVSKPSAYEALVSAAQRRLRRALHRSGAALSRVSVQLSARASAGRSAKRSAEARAMGIHPDLLDAVEPIYAMSGPTAVSMQASFAHTRFSHLELDVYRPTRRLPMLAFHRMLLLARTLMSAAMMVLYPLQAGSARLGPSRVHAGRLRRVAAEIKHCCQCLAAVLRSNAPVGPAIQQLGRLEEAFWELQKAVGEAVSANACSQAGHAAAEQMAEQLVAAAAAAEAAQAGAEAQTAAGQAEAVDDTALPAAGAFHPQQQPAVPAEPLADAGMSQDSLALHLALSMLFACCSRVRSMYLLLPHVLGKDQQGVAEAVAEHFATARAWNAVLRARTALEPEGCSPRSARDIFRRSKLLWGGDIGRGLARSRSAAALSKLAKPAVQVAEPAAPGTPPGKLVRAVGRVHRAFGAVERLTGFTRDQLALGMQMAVSFVAVMFLVVVPAVNAALAHRSVWAVFIIVVVHEPLLGSVIWKCVLRFGGTLVAGLLGLGALYFSVLCNDLSFEDKPAKFIAMTAALTVLSMPLAAGTAYYGPRNAYFWIVSCLIMFTVALPGYAYNSPMPILALWRLACTAIGIAIELLTALLVFPVTARSAAYGAAAGALRGMAQVAEVAFHSVLPSKAVAAGGGSREGSRRGWRLSLDRSHHHQQQRQQQQQQREQHQAHAVEAATDQPEEQQQEPPRADPQQQLQQHTPVLPSSQGAAPHALVQQQQPQQQAGQPEGQAGPPEQHVVVHCPSGTCWHGNEVATGAVLRRIHKPMMETYGRITTLRALLGPLRVEYHPFKTPHRFPTAPGRRAQRLCRRMLNVLTTFAITMDSHHTESVPLLEPHSAELEGLIQQLCQALRAMASMVAGDVSLEGAARTVAALEVHAQHLMLRVLLSGPPEGLSTVDATQGLAFLAMLFNVTSVARLLCVSLGEAFCPTDAAGQQAAAALLRDSPRWAGDDKLAAMAAELMSEALVCPDDEQQGTAV